jgi:hypothetical protein
LRRHQRVRRAVNPRHSWNRQGPRITFIRDSCNRLFSVVREYQPIFGFPIGGPKLPR